MFFCVLEIIFCVPEMLRACIFQKIARSAYVFMPYATDAKALRARARQFEMHRFASQRTCSFFLKRPLHTGICTWEAVRTKLYLN